MPYIGNAPYQGSVTSVNIIDGTIDTADLKDNSVTNSKLSGITTTYVSEGTGLYYTDARARGSLSFTSGSGAYNSTTGVITIPTNNNQLTNGSGYLTGNQTVTLSGDASGSGSTAIAVTLATVGASKGGTGQTSLTANNVILGNGTSPVQFVAPGSSGNVLTSNGTTWTSAAASGGSSALTISNKTAAYTIVAGDLGRIINCTSGTFTVSLTAAATLGSGFNCWIWNTSSTSTDAITIDPNGAETIDGVTTIILRQGEGTQIVCNGTNWQTGDKKTMRGYAENISSTLTRPVATGSGGVAIGWGSTASGGDSMAAGRSATASGTYAFAGPIGTASSTGSVAIGVNSGFNGSQAVTGAGATALGGSYASGTDSFAAAIASNSSSYGATGANSIAIGLNARATSNGSVAIGARWFGNTSTTAGGAVAIGDNTSASGSHSTAIGWEANSSFENGLAIATRGARATAQNSIAIGSGLASGQYSVALGQGAVANIYGKYAYAGQTSTDGIIQTGILLLYKITTDATATILTSDGGAASTTNQVILPNNSAFAFSALIVARQQASGGTQSAAWKIEGLIRREGSAGTTTLVNSATTVLNNTPGWTIAVSADTTNGGLAITATGAAATNIRWVATVQTSEVTYA